MQSYGQSHCHHHNLAYNVLIFFHDGNNLNLFIYRLKLILTLMFCSCCEFGSRSPLAAKASILDREHCARFHCDSAWSNLKASVVTSDLSRMLIVLYCDFQASGDWQTARQPRKGVRHDCDGTNPTLRRRKPLLPQRPGETMPARPTRPQAPTPPLIEVAQGNARPAECAAARPGKETKRRCG